MAKLTRKQFDKLCEKARALREKDARQVLVCAGTGCIASGSMKVYDALKAECEAKKINISVELKEHVDHDADGGYHLKKSGCHGFCEIGPLLAIEPLGIIYTRVKPEDVQWQEV